MVQPTNKRFLLESDRGIVNGVATLDGTGKLPEGQFPSRLGAPGLAGTYVEQAATLLNVKSKGALGDGTTNDTTAIHAARDTAATLGIGLYFPPGTYRTSVLTANKPNQVWELSPGATIKPVDASAGSILTVTAANFTLRGGGTLDGSTTTNVSSAGIYSYQSTTTDLLIENVTVKNTGGYGMQACGSRTIIRNCRFINTGNTGINLGPATSDMADCEIIGTLVDRSMIPDTDQAGNIFIAGTSGGLKMLRTKIRGNTLLMRANPTIVSNAGSAIGIEIHRGSLRTTISGNTTYNGAMGISVASGSHSTTVTGNTILGPNWYGIEIAESNFVTVSGNTIDGNGVLGAGTSSSTYGIVTNGIVQHVAIVGNTIANIASGATSSSAGICFTGTGSGATVAGNVMTVPCYGITVVNTPDVTITGNDINGGGSATTAVRLTGTPGKVAISGNMFDGFTNGVAIAMTSGVFDVLAVSGNTFVAVTNPSTVGLSGGATVGTNIKWSGNVGSGVVNTSNLPGDVGSRFITNYFYGPQFGTLANAAPPLNMMHAHPFIVAAGTGLTVSQVNITVATAGAGSSLRIGIYDDNNGVPGNLITEFTSAAPLDSTTTGDKAVTGLSRYLAPGRYWVATVAQGTTAPTVGILSGASPYVGRPSGSSTGHAAAYTTAATVTGALPASFGTPAGTNYAVTALLRAA